MTRKLSCGVCTNNFGCNDCFNIIMNTPLRERVKFCYCYLCSNTNSASCVELHFYQQDFTYYMENYENIEKEIDKIKKEIKKQNKKLFILYIKCLSRLYKIYENVIEKRYAPGGVGFIEARDHFYKFKY
jgi:hypothetical protein